MLKVRTLKRVARAVIAAYPASAWTVIVNQHFSTQLEVPQRSSDAADVEPLTEPWLSNKRNCDPLIPCALSWLQPFYRIRGLGLKEVPKRVLARSLKPQIMGA